MNQGFKMLEANTIRKGGGSSIIDLSVLGGSKQSF
jgi:hypothetical protein